VYHFLNPIQGDRLKPAPTSRYALAGVPFLNLKSWGQAKARPYQ
jgi:hypothetical protein